MEKLRNFIKSLKNKKGLLIIITAALLIELILAVQYYHTHNMLEEELEHRAESELTMKAILVKSTLNNAEDILKSHVWDLQRCLPQPDSMLSSVYRLVKGSRYVSGGFMAFRPYYYPQEGKFFEPFAMRDGDTIRTRIITRDYTKNPSYIKSASENSSFWLNPYQDKEAEDSLSYNTSFVMPMVDQNNTAIGVFGIDISLRWLSDTIDHHHIYPSSFNLLLTKEGDIITRPSAKRIAHSRAKYMASLINDSTVERNLSKSKHSTIIRFKEDGKKGSIFYATMKGVPRWQIAVVCYDKEVYGDLITLRYNMLLFMILGFAVLLYMIRSFAIKEKQLFDTNVKQERLSSELHIANKIQQAMILNNDMLNDVRPDLRVWGSLVPAKEVGGDLYCVFIRDEKFYFCIGDVSGKGIPSALIMAVTHTLFRNIATHESNPAHIMKMLNEIACHNNKTNIFSTIFIGVLDLPTGRLRYCNAGHDIPLMIRHSDNGCRELDTMPNLPIGLFEDFDYHSQEVTLTGDTTMFLYTDGLAEAWDRNHQQFGIERVKQVLAKNHDANPQLLQQRMSDEVSSFTEGMDQNDDLTMLIFRYIPTKEQNSLNEEIILKNDIKQVPILNDFMKGIASRLGIDTALSRKLRLATEEAVVNVIEYAYPAGVTGDIHVRAEYNGERLKLTITDNGIPFDPTQKDKADISLSAEERPIGGLGILLVRELMDSINYEREGTKNVLTLRKNLTTHQTSKH